MTTIEKPDIEALRRAYKVREELHRWLDNLKVLIGDKEDRDFEKDVKRQLTSDIRKLSGVGSELWKVRLWAIHSAGESVAKFLGCDQPDVLTSALCWMAQQGYNADWEWGVRYSHRISCSPRAVPTDFLDRVYTRTKVITEAAGVPDMPARPLGRRFANGSEVWNAAFAALTDESSVDDGISLLEKFSNSLLCKISEQPEVYIWREYLYHAENARMFRYRVRLAEQWKRLTGQGKEPPPHPMPFGYIVRWFPEGLEEIEEQEAARYVPRVKLLSISLPLPLQEEHEEVARVIHQVRQREQDAARTELGLPPQS